ncbi:MAG: class I SAM-dependent methyltransferase [Chloroflexi bacterium]|nr:class I SAM-dependent methyltransferase [Chloroflexota bacterium]
MTESNPYIQSLLTANPLREPLLRSLIESLHLPRGSQGADIGCGIGLQALLLAESVGPHGRVTGVDIAAELLAYGERLAAEAGLSDRVDFRQSDAAHLPFADDSLDWAWSADCIGYPTGDLIPQLNELIRVVKPGGSILLLGWTGQSVLPGYPLLEARLNAGFSGYLPHLQGKAPDQHFARASRWFQAAGLTEVEAQTFAGSAQAPLTPGVHAALTALFQMLWMPPTPAAAESEDWGEMQRLCSPESPDFILDQPGYYAFFTYSLFRGRVPD